MNENEFIKYYFTKKSFINEAEAQSALSSLKDIGSGILDLAKTDPFYSFIITIIQLELAKKATDKLQNFKGVEDFFDSFLKKDKKEVLKKSKPNKNEAIKRNEKLRVLGLLKNNPGLYLKYFLIVYTLYRFEENVDFNRTESNELFDLLENNNYKCPFTGELFRGSKIIITDLKINGNELDQDMFYKLLEEIFVTNQSNGVALYSIINSYLKPIAKIQQNDIKTIFDRYYSFRAIKYKIPN